MHDEFCTRDETDRNLLSQNCCFRDLDYMAAVIKYKGAMSKNFKLKRTFLFLNLQQILYLNF